MRFNLWLGRRVGWIIYILSGKRKHVTYSNLKAAFCKEKTPCELRKLTKKVYRHLGQTFVELASLTKVDEKYATKYIKITNIERLEEASKNPKGMVFLTAHLGNWELCAVKSVHSGFPLYILARDQKMKKLNELLHRLRESKGNFVIRKGMDVKNIFRVLRDGHSVGIVGDQNAGVNGELIGFFDRPASTPIGPFRIAQKTGAWILPSFIHREEGPYHEVVLEEIMKIGKDEDIVPYMKKYNSLLEKHTRNYPDQWFWMHKRWKLTPEKKILVLDDGKKGHLKQSMAVVKQIRRYREDEGFAPEHLVVETVRIRFKSKALKTVFNFLTPVLTTFLQLHIKLLAKVLEKESYENAINRYADVIVSCGSTLFGVNKALKMENSARNVTVLDPGSLNRASFNLIVLPRHDASDNDEAKDNVAVTDLAPNLIDAESISRFKPSVSKTGKKIGLLLGGDNPCFGFGKALTKDIAKNIKIACEQLDGYAHITTSRRTPSAAEEVLAEEFDSFPRLAEFISGKDDKDEHTVEKILAVSDIVIVSGESISMVSEAVSSGRPVMVFMPDKKSEKITKYEKFVEELRERGYLVIVKPDDIPAEANDLISAQGKCKSSEDNKRIYDKLYRLF
jgi:KDO2-lipid IV(A) lauroyltransferase